jgi:nitrate reductase gamma subunit
MTTSVLFGAFPYAAVIVLGCGLLARYLATSPRRADVEAAKAWALFGGGKIWLGGFLALAVLHVGGALLPQAILGWNGVPLRLYVLEGTGFAVGLLALGWWVGVMRRHLQRSSASTMGEVADCVLLALLFVGIGSGLLMAGLYRWGSSWSAVTLVPYVVSLLRGVPQASLVEQMPALVQLHVASTFAMMLVFPFTRAASLATFAVHWAFGFTRAPLSVVAGAARGWLDRHDPATWLWPEEAWDESAARAPMVVVPVNAKLSVATESRQSVPTARHSGSREAADSFSLETDAEMEKTGSDVG